MGVHRTQETVEERTCTSIIGAATISVASHQNMIERDNEQDLSEDEHVQTTAVNSAAHCAENMKISSGHERQQGAGNNQNSVFGAGVVEHGNDDGKSIRVHNVGPDRGRVIGRGRGRPRGRPCGRPRRSARGSSIRTGELSGSERGSGQVGMETSVAGRGIGHERHLRSRRVEEGGRGREKRIRLRRGRAL